VDFLTCSCPTTASLSIPFDLFQLRDVLLGKLAESESSEGVTVDVVEWLTKAAIDMIGLAGFDYEFGSLAGKTNEFSDALHVLISSFQFNPWAIMQLVSPILRLLVGHAALTLTPATSRFDLFADLA
jgi:hypothetical protein